MKYLIVLVAILTLVFPVVSLSSILYFYKAPTDLLRIFLMQDPKLTKKQRKIIEHITEICIEQEALSKEQVTILEKGITDRKIKCFSECFIKKLGFYAHGKIIIGKIKEKLVPMYGDAKVERAIEKCKIPKISDECEKSYFLFICYRETLHHK